MSRAKIAEKLDQQGLVLLGVVPLKQEKDYPAFVDWLRRGWHAGMSFLEQNQSCRADPRILLDQSKCAVLLALPYAPRPDVGASDELGIARYARLRDYHKVIKQKCDPVVRWFMEETGSDRSHWRVVVDSAPVLERSLAARTVQGFIGKNTCYIHPDLGSFFVIGSIFSTVGLDEDAASSVDPRQRAANGGCGSCKRCSVHCPTGALDQPWKLDARKCLAYYTIEHRTTIPVKYWRWLGKTWFGCDICQSVCPYNRKTVEVDASLVKIKSLDLRDVVTMDQSYYEQKFGGTPMTRAKIAGLRRNAFISLMVQGQLSQEDVAAVGKRVACELMARTISQIPEWIEEKKKWTKA